MPVTGPAIAFDLDGIILEANANFLDAVGYQAGEIVGQHHRMFVDPVYAAGPDYAAFWADLRRGSFRSGVFQRRGRHGREVWLQASYNPILDAAGRPYKVMKFAADITMATQARLHAWIGRRFLARFRRAWQEQSPRA